MTPRPLFDRRRTMLKQVRTLLARSRRIILFLDFDGTLVPIQKTPLLATLPTGTRALLRKLSNHPNIVVALVTGRSQADIQAKVRLRNVFWIANHGFEISMRRSHWVHPTAKEARLVLGQIARKLKRALARVQGLLIENKRYSLTVHYRNVLGPSVGFVKGTTRRLLRPYQGNLRITTGKKVLEVRPDAPWNKGHAVEHVLRRLRPDKTTLVVYAGDDSTDEDAFKHLRGRALTILVGRRTVSHASYRVPSPKAVALVLEMIPAATSDSDGR
jgi:trehalose 6-phosphate phosphatase